jgi:phosphopantothenoylcysteine decarboxylase/phosphopantothenate--cysteine ligase
MENGRAKLLRKGADAIVVNDVASEGVGIDSDLNAATFLTLTTAIELPEMPKRKLADRILDEIVTLRRPRSMVVELDGLSTQDGLSNQDKILSQSAVPPRRQLIVE